MIEITPGHSPLARDLHEMWRARELLYFLTWRDIKVRYKQTTIGVLWVLLQPALTTAILTVVFSTFARFDTPQAPYPLFVLSGIVLWHFVYTAITVTSNCFVNNTNLVTKVYFPRLIVPLASTMAFVVDLFISLPILAIVMVYFGTSVSWNLLLAPLFVALALIQTAAFGILFSALNVRFRDVKFALPFFLQLWMPASPIFYPSSMIPEKWRLVFAVNPLVGIVEGFRASLFGSPFDWPVIGISFMSVMFLTIVSVIVFRRMEDGFADLI